LQPLLHPTTDDPHRGRDGGERARSTRSCA
jgi:hypothetical protein